jgi:hypothetical protein
MTESMSMSVLTESDISIERASSISLAATCGTSSLALGDGTIALALGNGTSSLALGNGTSASGAASDGLDKSLMMLAFVFACDLPLAFGVAGGGFAASGLGGGIATAFALTGGCFAFLNGGGFAATIAPLFGLAGGGFGAAGGRFGVAGGGFGLAGGGFGVAGFARAAGLRNTTSSDSSSSISASSSSVSSPAGSRFSAPQSNSDSLLSGFAPGNASSSLSTSTTESSIVVSRAGASELSLEREPDAGEV